MGVQLFYFAIRGRGEPIRLALSALNIEWDEKGVDYAVMKSDVDHFAFCQCPRLVDDDGLDISQSNAIMRHLGRKHGLMGSSLADAAHVDMLMDGVEDLKRKYLTLIYQDQLAEEAKSAFWTAHIDPATATGARNGGAHFAYLEKLVSRAGTGGWAVGDKLSVADILLYDLFDCHQRVFKERLAEACPGLAAVHARVAGLEGVKAYLASPRLFEKVNNNGLG